MLVLKVLPSASLEQKLCNNKPCTFKTPPLIVVMIQAHPRADEVGNLHHPPRSSFWHRLQPILTNTKFQSWL